MQFISTFFYMLPYLRFQCPSLAFCFGFFYIELFPRANRVCLSITFPEDVGIFDVVYFAM